MPDSKTPTRPHGYWTYAWLLVVPVAFVVYALSFDDFPILEKKHSVLAETDSACFTLMIRDFHMTKQYGDPYERVNRGVGDVAQKHKTHHVLYLLVAAPLYGFFSWAYHALGITFLKPEYSVNAAIACVNMVLLFVLLSGAAGKGNLPGILTCFYAVSLNTWILGSVPESWTFSATLVLLFLLLLRDAKDRFILLSAAIGIAMLNNIFLCTLALFLLFLHARKAGSFKTFMFRSAVTGLVAAGTWAVLMTALSVFDGGLSPLEYVRYTLWFKKNIAPPIVVSDGYFWKVSITNLFINGVVSNQADPNIPQEAILLTFRQSTLGIVSTAGYLALMSLALYRGADRMARKIPGAGFRSFLSGELPGAPELAFCILWVAMGVFLDTSGAFLFSSIVVPLLIVLVGYSLHFNRAFDRYLLCAVITLMLINNANQVLKFRHVLAGMQ